MKVLVTILFAVQIAFFCAEGQRDESIRRDYTYLESTGSYYKIYAIDRTWSRALNQCKNDGAFLYFPENENEAIAVMEFWNETFTLDHFFIGISDLNTKGFYQTVDGRPMTDVYWHWGDGEPNDADGAERCLVLRRDLTYNDDNCGREYAHICKIPGEITKKNEDQHTKDFCKLDYAYIESTDAYYKVYTDHRNWWNAKRHCENEGASLFYAEDDDEATAVIELWNKTTNHDHFYVGISDLKMKGYFETIDGQPLSDVHHVWGQGEPNDASGREDCLVLRRDRTLNDDSCAWQYPYICKKFKETIKWNCECNMPNVDYIYKTDFGHCYKFHNKPKNWTEAVASCAADDSYLAIANNEEEAMYFKDLIKKHNHINDPDLALKGIVYLGFYEDDEGWKTIDGDLLETTNYNTWSQKTVGAKPSRVDEQYGALMDDGKLNKRSGTDKLYYICEHEIGSETPDIEDNENKSFTVTTEESYGSTTTEKNENQVPGEYKFFETGGYVYHTNKYTDYYINSTDSDSDSTTATTTTDDLWQLSVTRSYNVYDVTNQPTNFTEGDITIRTSYDNKTINDNSNFTSAYENDINNSTDEDIAATVTNSYDIYDAYTHTTETYNVGDVRTSYNNPTMNDNSNFTSAYEYDIKNSTDEDIAVIVTRSYDMYDAYTHNTETYNVGDVTSNSDMYDVTSSTDEASTSNDMNFNSNTASSSDDNVTVTSSYDNISISRNTSREVYNVADIISHNDVFDTNKTVTSTEIDKTTPVPLAALFSLHEPIINSTTKLHNRWARLPHNF